MMHGDSPPLAVLQAFGWKPSLDIISVPPGFSGAAVWKVTATTGSFALKRWPSDFQPDWQRITHLSMLAQQHGYHLLPVPHFTIQRQPYIKDQGVHWSACSWMTGQPVATPNEEQLQTAMQSLAQLHRLWQRHAETATGPSPSVQHQIMRLEAWTEAEYQQIARSSHPLHLQALALLRSHRHSAIERLRPWQLTPLPLHYVLGDVWAEHLLYTGDSLTGIIDLATIRLDHPAHDLARLLGSYCAGDARRRAQALEYYPHTDPHLESLTIALDEAGAIVALGNWLRWLVLENRPHLNHTAAHTRLQCLVNRLHRLTTTEF
ncbi:MAG: phosphotransferase [Gemmatales bacterium]